VNNDLIAVMLHLTPTAIAANANANVKAKKDSGMAVAVAGGGGSGYYSYAAFMDLLRQVDPALSAHLHDYNGRKPFTLSCLLQNGRMATGQLYPNQQYALRLTSLNAPVFDTFVRRFLTLTNGSTGLNLRIGNADFALTRIEGSGDFRRDWVGRSSFVQLVQNARQELEQGQDKFALARNWHFNFVTPTVFSMGEKDWGARFELLPLPHLVFSSLATNWNAFMPMPTLPIQEVQSIDKAELENYVKEYVVITSHETRSTQLTIKGHPQVGFTGRVQYRLMDKKPPAHLAATLTALVQFANFAGIGYKTTMGMGQVRAGTS
jgi:CRISPR-associated endoribonuclease Cas6